jgi:hypothetical protein
MEETVLKIRITTGQQMLEEMFNIPDHKGNGNQNYAEIPPHPSQNGNHQEKTKNSKCWRECRGKGTFTHC